MTVLVVVLILILVHILTKNDSLKHELRRQRGLPEQTQFNNSYDLWFEDDLWFADLEDEACYPHDDIEKAASRPLSKDDQEKLRQLRREDAKRHAEQAEGEEKRQWEDILEEIDDDD